MKDEKKYELVGDIPIKKPKAKKNKGKKSSKNDTSLGIKILVLFMFIAMAASFFGSLIYYFVSIITQS